MSRGEEAMKTEKERPTIYKKETKNQVLGPKATRVKIYKEEEDIKIVNCRNIK